MAPAAEIETSDRDPLLAYQLERMDVRDPGIKSMRLIRSGEGTVNADVETVPGLDADVRRLIMDYILRRLRYVVRFVTEVPVRQSQSLRQNHE
jgi:hypothetical protein